LAALGLFLALGGFNPVYFLLVKLVPGFALFRAPARWLALYALGASGLAGLGLDSVGARSEENQQIGARCISPWIGWLVTGGVLGALVLAGQLLGGDGEPDLAPALGLRSMLGWLGTALSLGLVFFLGLRSNGLRSRRRFVALLMVLVSVELVGASLFLPLNRATTPGALTSLRPAVAHLLGEAQDAALDPPARFLSISNIFFDPGDKDEIEIVLRPQLSEDAVYDYIIATKQKEVLIPNLPLYYRLPAVDGFDGGVLPLRHYVTLQHLYMPKEQVAIDGRLRENLVAVPDGRWLSLFNVRYVVTDKVGDAWFDGTFYDLQMGATLGHGDEAEVGCVPALPATALGVVYELDEVAAAGPITIGVPLAVVEVTFTGGRKQSLNLVSETSDPGMRVARLSWDQVETPSSVRVRGAWDGGRVTLRGLSLIDERTDVFQPLVLSDTGRYRLVHSGDVKIYENLEVLPRAFFVHRAIFAADDEDALMIMRDPNFNPATTVVLDDSVAAVHVPGSALDVSSRASGAQVELLRYESERITASVLAPADGWLLLSDAWYPGWEAKVDGQAVPVERADILFRAVQVPAGKHQVELVYQPASFRLGVAISLSVTGLLLAWVAWEGLKKATLRA
jgi:hypothetical protein